MLINAQRYVCNVTYYSLSSRRRGRHKGIKYVRCKAEPLETGGGPTLTDPTLQRVCFGNLSYTAVIFCERHSVPSLFGGQPAAFPAPQFCGKLILATTHLRG